MPFHDLIHDGLGHHICAKYILQPKFFKCADAPRVEHPGNDPWNFVEFGGHFAGHDICVILVSHRSQGIASLDVGPLQDLLIIPVSLKLDSIETCPKTLEGIWILVDDDDVMFLLSQH